MKSILSKVNSGIKTAGRPPAAVEISPEGVLAATRPGGKATGAEPQYAFVALPAGAVVPGIEEPNLRAPEIVAKAIGAALEQLSLRSRSVTVVLPDTSVRVFMLDFDSLPAKSSEAIPVLQFRLRKMVPFDVEHAGVSYQILTQDKTECRVLAAIIPGPILSDYESAIHAAGFESGAVLPSSLAALEIADPMEAVLSVNLSGHALTTTIANGQDLLLYRTLELPEDQEQRVAEIQRGIAVAGAYFEDKLQVRPRRLYYAGNQPASEFAAWLGDPELTVFELASRPDVGAMTALGNICIASVTGALAGVS